MSLEDPDVQSFAMSDPRGFLATTGKKAILDEVQRVPELLSYIQGLVDADSTKAQYVLTGSHQLELGQALSQSLAGRTALLTLLPLSLEELERAGRSAEQCILEGSMPGRHADAINIQRFYRSYL